MNIKNISQYVKTLGPGLLYAGAAIGVSHLVQSTRAGAEFGFKLIWVVLLANVLKYPFFEIGPRYTAGTGKSLLHGYQKLGPWALVLFCILTLCTMFTIQAAVTVVTAGLAMEIFGIHFNAKVVSSLILTICTIILLLGRYSFLDKLVKIIIVTLTVTTVASVIGALIYVPSREFENPFDFMNKSHILFVVALAGWMPAPLDISVWHSIWAEEKNKELNTRVSLSDSLTDFKIGYIGTIILAIGFVSLGSTMMYGNGEALSPNAGKFAGQLMNLYTESLGTWSYPIIALACFTTMFSTTITCLDAFPRSLRQATVILIDDKKGSELEAKKFYNIWLVITALGASCLLFFFLDNMKSMVDFATTLSFVMAPIYAFLNYLAITHKDVPEEARLNQFQKVSCFIGLTCLTGFALYYLYFKYFS